MQRVRLLYPNRPPESLIGLESAARECTFQALRTLPRLAALESQSQVCLTFKRRLQYIRTGIDPIRKIIFPIQDWFLTRCRA